MKKLVLVETANYIFSDYFKNDAYIDEIVNYFDYTFEQQENWQEMLPYVNLNNEMAKREFLIIPLLLGVVRYTHAKLKSKVALEISDKLKDSLNYLLQAKHNFLVVEAKNI